MAAIKLLPVIDLLDGVVVRGVAGQRKSYHPVESQIASDATPYGVATAFRTRGYSEAYVADLDAIMDHRLSVKALRIIADAGLDIWLDAGLRSVDDLFSWPSWLAEQTSAIVLGAETVGPDQLGDLIRSLGPRAVFSLDLVRGEMLGDWRGQSPEDAATVAYDAGCRRIIALDLAGVGMSQGVPTLAICARLKNRHSDIELTSGGGVRHGDDLMSLEECGCDYALVASALHDQSIS